jgi:hypothetical protein
MNTGRNIRRVWLIWAAALAIAMLGPATAAAEPPDPCTASCGTIHHH